MNMNLISIKKAVNTKVMTENLLSATDLANPVPETIGQLIILMIGLHLLRMVNTKCIFRVF